MVCTKPRESVEETMTSSTELGSDGDDNDKAVSPFIHITASIIVVHFQFIASFRTCLATSPLIDMYSFLYS